MNSNPRLAGQDAFLVRRHVPPRRKPRFLLPCRHEVVPFHNNQSAGMVAGWGIRGLRTFVWTGRGSSHLRISGSAARVASSPARTKAALYSKASYL